MTCVIGARGADGCAIVADTRITREFEATNESKFHILWDRVTLAGAGTTALLDKFAEGLGKSAIPSSPDLDDITVQVEDIVHGIWQRYVPRLGRDCGLEALIMGLEKFSKGDPFIRRVLGEGVTEHVNEFAIIGHGAPYVSMLFRALYDPMLTASELGVLGWFSVTALAQSGLDQTVGIGPIGAEAVILRANEQPRFLNPLEAEFKAARESLSGYRFRLKLVKSVWGTPPQAYENLPPGLL